jgi:hypothetical protein
VFEAMVSGQGINIPGFERSAVWVYEDIAERKRLGGSARRTRPGCSAFSKTAPWV